MSSNRGGELLASMNGEISSLDPVCRTCSLATYQHYKKNLNTYHLCTSQIIVIFVDIKESCLLRIPRAYNILASPARFAVGERATYIFRPSDSATTPLPINTLCRAQLVLKQTRARLTDTHSSISPYQVPKDQKLLIQLIIVNTQRLPAIFFVSSLRDQNKRVNPKSTIKASDKQHHVSVLIIFSSLWIPISDFLPSPLLRAWERWWEVSQSLDGWILDKVGRLRLRGVWRWCVVIRKGGRVV